MAIYYFDALPTLPKDYPLDAGPFVERSASIDLAYSRTSPRIDNREKLSNGSGYDVGLVLRRPDTPLYAAAAYGHSDNGKFRNSPSATSASDTDFYDLAIGAYAARNMLLVLDWARSVTRTTNSFSSGPDIEFKNVNVSVGLGVTHLAELANGHHLVWGVSGFKSKLELEDSPSEKSRGIGLSATYYPTRMLGLSGGLGYVRGDGSFSDYDSWLVGASFFATPTVRLSLIFSQLQAKAAGSDLDWILLSISARF